MSTRPSRSKTRTRRAGVALAGATVGLAVLAAITVAKSFTLEVGKNARVTNQNNMTVHENIVLNSRGRAVYELSGDSKSHPECTKLYCFGSWPPVKVASRSALSKAPGVKGRLGIWHRNGFNQVTLNGHPLYTYVGDTAKDQANSQGIREFGGAWGVVRAGASGSRAGGGGSTGTPTWG